MNSSTFVLNSWDISEVPETSLREEKKATHTASPFTNEQAYTFCLDVV
jgi:hypothetical protein